jgi:hypothetical protein
LPQIRKTLAALLNESIALAVEEQLFQRWAGESKRYTSQGRELIVNLRDPNNPDLKERILTGGITPEELSVATSEVNICLYCFIRVVAAAVPRGWLCG